MQPPPAPSSDLAEGGCGVGGDPLGALEPGDHGADEDELHGDAGGSPQHPRVDVTADEVKCAHGGQGRGTCPACMPMIPSQKGLEGPMGNGRGMRGPIIELQPVQTSWEMS